MPTVTTEVEVDVDLDDFCDEDLIEELERRGKGFEVAGRRPAELVTEIYEKRRLGKNFDRELDDLIYATIGRVV